MMRRHGLNRSIKLILYSFLIAEATSVAVDALAGPPEEPVIEQQIDAMVRLHAQMADQINTARTIRADLLKREREYIREIREAGELKSNRTYAAAITDHRIANNLKLVQLVSGYCHALDETIATFQQYLITIKYLISRAEDDLKMHKALESFDTEELLTEIEHVTTYYRTELNANLIKTDHIVVRSCESIWNEIVAGRL